MGAQGPGSLPTPYRLVPRNAAAGIGLTATAPTLSPEGPLALHVE